MKRFYAERFLALSNSLGALDQIVSDLSSKPDTQLPDAFIKISRDSLESIFQECKATGLQASSLIVSRLKKEHPRMALELASQLKLMNGAIEDEVKASLLFRIDTEDAEYYQSQQPFGEQVEKAFPSAIHDIGESVKCFALDRHTASVFHAMRVMEHGLRAMAKELKVPFETHDQWQKVIDCIQSKIAQLDKEKPKPAGWRDKRDFLSGAAVYFRDTKNGWRNHVSHSRKEYKESDAETVIRSVNSFMQQLSERLQE